MDNQLLDKKNYLTHVYREPDNMHYFSQFIALFSEKGYIITRGLELIFVIIHEERVNSKFVWHKINFFNNMNPSTFDLTMSIIKCVLISAFAVK